MRRNGQRPAKQARARAARIRLMLMECPVVVEAGLAAQLGARYALVRTRPEVVVIDCNSCAAGAIQAIAKLRAGGAKVLALSSSQDRYWMTGMLRAGVEGFLTRVSRWSELFAAIDALAEGRRVYGPEVAQAFADLPPVAMDIVDGQSWELDPIKVDGGDVSGASLTLSRREAQILQFIATGRSNAAIGAALSISVHTVRKHRENLMAKLGLHNVAEVTAFALRNHLLRPSAERRARAPIAVAA